MTRCCDSIMESSRAVSAESERTVEFDAAMEWSVAVTAMPGPRESVTPRSQSVVTPKCFASVTSTESGGSLRPVSQPEYLVCLTPKIDAKDC